MCGVGECMEDKEGACSSWRDSAKAVRVGAVSGRCNRTGLSEVFPGPFP